MFNYKVNFISIWTLINIFFLLLDSKINVAKEKIVEPQTKPHQTVLRNSVWVGLGKSAVRFGLEKSQIVYLWFGLGYIPNRKHPYWLGPKNGNVNLTRMPMSYEST